ncbi:MAG: transposase, partial [Anaerolineales bacterium]
MDTPVCGGGRGGQLGTIPQRVRQSLKPIFVLIGSPARAPKRRGKPPGWPKGRPRAPKTRQKVA